VEPAKFEIWAITPVVSTVGLPHFSIAGAGFRVATVKVNGG